MTGVTSTSKSCRVAVAALMQERGWSVSAETLDAASQTPGRGSTERGGAITRPGRRGYTVVELLIIMVTVSIVVVIALPPMFATIRGTRLEAAQQAFIGDLRLARMEAIRRNVSIAVQKTSATTYTIDSIGGRTLEDGVTFTAGPTTLRFAPFGPVPTGEATYTLHLNGKSRTVFVTTAGNAIAR